MSHPMEHLKSRDGAHKRLSHIIGSKEGGTIHSDAPADMKLIKAMVKGPALKADGEKSAPRLDKYARGGKVKSGKTNVNVIIAPQGADHQGMPPGAMPPAPMAPKPPIGPMATPGAGPGLPPGAPPGLIRANGGRAYAKGGAVKGTSVWEEGVRNGTQVSHSPGKNDTDKIDHHRALLTRKTGGRIEAGKGMGPKMDAGADTGEGRLEKIKAYGSKR